MIRSMSRRALLIVAGWLAAAAAAIGTGLAGVQVIGGGITTGSGGDVLTSAEAADQLARAGPPPAASPSTAVPSPSAMPSSATSPPAGPTNLRTLTGTAGFVIAGCTPAGAVLISWTPAQGYSIERADPGPGGEYAEVRFRSGGGRSGKGNGEVRVRVRCVGGVPVAEWRT
jgi:hypothetical protein